MIHHLASVIHLHQTLASLEGQSECLHLNGMEWGGGIQKQDCRSLGSEMLSLGTQGEWLL